MAIEIYKECKASTIVITSVFKFDGKAGKGKLKLKMDVSKDARSERSGNETPQPKGTAAALAFEKKAGAVLKRYRGKP